MNRQEFIEQYLELVNLTGIKPEDMYVVAGGSMLLHGLRESTDDIDTTVDRRVFEVIAAKLPERTFTIDSRHPSGKVVLSYRDFDIHLEENPSDKIVMIDGVACQSLEDILVLKRKWRREKDLRDIEVITHHLSKIAESE